MATINNGQIIFIVVRHSIDSYASDYVLSTDSIVRTCFSSSVELWLVNLIYLLIWLIWETIGHIYSTCCCCWYFSLDYNRVNSILISVLRYMHWDERRKHYDIFLDVCCCDAYSEISPSLLSLYENFTTLLSMY